MVKKIAPKATRAILRSFSRVTSSMSTSCPQACQDQLGAPVASSSVRKLVRSDVRMNDRSSASHDRSSKPVRAARERSAGLLETTNLRPLADRQARWRYRTGGSEADRTGKV